ncbi:MAG: SGNH/GDSL hydrolase family protein, partial [Clostridia bacterium]|nr:SGNH/GDSL hydrolase family protein [Clostridia bacterium]
MEIKGKIINFLGDSITEGIGLDDVKDCYDRVLLRKCEPKEIRNYSISGSRLAHQSKPSTKAHYDLCFCGRAFYMDRNADIIVVYGGVND